MKIKYERISHNSQQMEGRRILDKNEYDAKFLDIISGVALSFIRDIFILSSSTFDGTTLQVMPLEFKISFLTLLFEAKIMLFITLTINFVNFYY